MFIASLWVFDKYGWEHRMFIEFSYVQWTITKEITSAFIFKSEKDFWDNWETIQYDLNTYSDCQCNFDKILIKEAEFKVGYKILEKPLEKPIDKS